MTPKEIKDIRNWLGLSQSDFAMMLGIASDRTIRRWEDGDKNIPGPVEVLCDLIETFPEVCEYLWPLDED